MAHKDDLVMFNVHCGKCLQPLSFSHRDGDPVTSDVTGATILFKHDNPADCDAGDVELPALSPERFGAAFVPIKKKAAPKKTSKK